MGARRSLDVDHAESGSPLMGLPPGWDILIVWVLVVAFVLWFCWMEAHYYDD